MRNRTEKTSHFLLHRMSLSLSLTLSLSLSLSHNERISAYLRGFFDAFMTACYALPGLALPGLIDFVSLNS